MRMLENFIFKICKAQANWQMERLIGKMVEGTPNRNSGSRAIIGLSAGSIQASPQRWLQKH
jgi:hypothetical protein